MSLRMFKENNRRSTIIKYLQAKGTQTLSQIKEGFREANKELPMATYGDLPLQEWLRSIDGVKWEINGRVPRYFVEKIARRANSPLECPKESKRRMAESVASDWSNVESPNKDDWSYENSPNKNGGNVESPSEDWSDVVSLNKNWSNAKTPNKICVNVESPKENWRSEKPVQCEEICEDKMSEPNLFQNVLLGDQNFLNMALFDLGFKQEDDQRIRQSGHCVSGLRISEATKRVQKMDEKVEHVIINVGSVDIAEGRQLIEMIKDLSMLLTACNRKKITPILTTLTPLPNHAMGNQQKILTGYNDFIRLHLKSFYSVIDLYKCLLDKKGLPNMSLYQPDTRHISGSRKSFLLWNKPGRRCVRKMLIKNLGHAVVYKGNFIGELI